KAKFLLKIAKIFLFIEIERFIQQSLIGNAIAGTSPGISDVWRVDDIYAWDENVSSYHEGDIVIHNNGIFYEARRDTEGEEPKRNPLAFDRWRRIGNRFEGNNSKFFLELCDGVEAQV
ncbi:MULTISPECIES: hypothetical protein, partial [unclassified Francisella]|uniref:hypothetical protein n=1 Tax=unclassified Francisella TaxID=2610885 RepID=UPI002E31D7BB